MYFFSHPQTKLPPSCQTPLHLQWTSNFQVANLNKLKLYPKYNDFVIFTFGVFRIVCISVKMSLQYYD